MNIHPYTPGQSVAALTPVSPLVSPGTAVALLTLF